MTLQKIKKNGGFVILFAVTISSILLAIALGVAEIALKELKFGTSARNTNDAFFAADTGAEYALFYDKAPSIYPSDVLTIVPPITGLGSTGQSCVKVTVDKRVPAVTTIVSKGYNIGDPSCDSTNPDRIERELLVKFGGSGSPPTYTKITLTNPMLEQFDIGSLVSNNAIDNDTNTQAWHTDDSNIGAWLKIDLGSGEESLVRTRLYLDAPGYIGDYSIQYSDNDSSWTNAIDSFIPSVSGWNDATWGNVGTHQYWRFYLNNPPPGPGPGPNIQELELYK